MRRSLFAFGLVLITWPSFAETPVETALQKEIARLADPDFRSREDATKKLGQLIENNGVFDTQILQTIEKAIENTSIPEVADRLQRPEITKPLLWQQIGAQAARLKDLEGVKKAELIEDIENQMMVLGGFAPPVAKLKELFTLLYPKFDANNMLNVEQFVLRNGYNDRCRIIPRLAWVWSFWLAREAYASLERNIYGCANEKGLPGAHYWKAIHMHLANINQDRKKISALIEHILRMHIYFSPIGREDSKLVKGLLPSKGNFNSDELKLLAALWQCEKSNIEFIPRFVDSLLTDPNVAYEYYSGVQDSRLMRELAAKKKECSSETAKELLRLSQESLKKISESADFNKSEVVHVRKIVFMRFFLLMVGLSYEPNEKEWKSFQEHFEQMANKNFEFYAAGIQIVIDSLKANTPDFIKHTAIAKVLQLSSWQSSQLAQTLIPILVSHDGPWTQEVTDLYLSVLDDAAQNPGQKHLQKIELDLVQALEALEAPVLPQRLIDALSQRGIKNWNRMIATSEIKKKK